jgi:hypothetical protein
MTNDEPRKRLRELLRNEIPLSEVPDKIYTAIHNVFELWRPAKQLDGIAHWHWQPTFRLDKNGEPTIISQCFEVLIDLTADRLIEHFHCERRVALMTAIKLVETEAGGPMKPPDGVRAYLERWAAAGE